MSSDRGTVPISGKSPGVSSGHPEVSWGEGSSGLFGHPLGYPEGKAGPFYGRQFLHRGTTLRFNQGTIGMQLLVKTCERANASSVPAWGAPYYIA